MNGIARANRYVDSVLENPVLYPLTIKQACDRYKSDLLRKDVYLNEDTANYVVSVVESMPHTKGTLQGQPLILEDWQCFFYVNIFGWKWTETDLRRFRYADLYVPRKNGKTAMAIPAMLLMFAVDQEPGAEVFLGAVGEQHAKRLLYKPAKYICQHHADFADTFNIEVNASSIVRTDNDSILTTVIKDPNDGDSPHAALVDEYHEHPNNNQYETFDTGMGGRDQPLLMVISTAGTDLGSPCKSQMDECERILNGTYKADDKFCMLFVPDKDDEWDSIETLRKVNPNIGISVGEKYLLSQLEKAKQSSEKQSTFKTKHCNFWVGAKVAWMNMLAWQRQKDHKLKIEDFKGEECHIGLDLASKKDLTSMSILFKRGEDYYGFDYFYAPEEAARNNDRYPQFVTSGELELTGGNKTDYTFLIERIKQVCKDYEVLSLGIDPYQAAMLTTELQGYGINILDYDMNVKTMSEPMKEFEACVLDRKYHHNGNTCMTWQMGNVVARLDAKDNIYPNKANRNDERCKIDGVVSMIMAFGRWMDEDQDSKPYADRGFRTL